MHLKAVPYYKSQDSLGVSSNSSRPVRHKIRRQPSVRIETQLPVFPAVIHIESHCVMSPEVREDGVGLAVNMEIFCGNVSSKIIKDMRGVGVDQRPLWMFGIINSERDWAALNF